MRKAGPLVGPVLAAQMGYLPGTIWIIVGVIFAGAVQDMVILFFSQRRDGKSLGQIEMHPTPALLEGVHRRPQASGGAPPKPRSAAASSWPQSAQEVPGRAPLAIH